MTQSLVIVSNRLPISVKKIGGKLEFYPSVGGLATGLASYVNDKHNKWIGWPGIENDKLTEPERQQITAELGKSNCYPVFLNKKQLEYFYNGYSNSILWPLFHNREPSPKAKANQIKYWNNYRSVNSAFASNVLALSEDNSTIWVHDYQLLLLPGLIRSARPKAKIGFFLHIPFPQNKYIRQIISAPSLITGILGADLIGMHTKLYVKNFLEVCGQLSGHIINQDRIIQGTHISRVVDLPMGIDYERFRRAQNLATVKQALKKSRSKYKGLKVILTVDRLDPTKGLTERLEAYSEFLHRNPAILGKVVMVMLAVPSRTDIEEYKQLRKQVENLVEQINRSFGTAKWQPVDYMYTSMPVEDVTALYQLADIAFITPLRDGMNLVAKEYIASRPNRDGVLILSTTAGAAQELTDALLVNPRNSESLVSALSDALKMPKRELKSRINSMHDLVSTYTVQSWASSFMKNLQQPVGITPRITRSLIPERQQDILESYKKSHFPLLLLDYDGVLAPLVAKPSEAAPNRVLLNLLNKLAQQAKLEVAVISGRSQNDLQRWLGQLPISLIAEHGGAMRPYKKDTSLAKSKRKWEHLSTVPSDWHEIVRPILEKYALITPGAFVEVKKFSLVWHYRLASPYYSQKHLVILRRILRPIASKHGLGVYSGKKVLEIKPLDVNKGTAAARLIELGLYNHSPDFILCIGDDYTDEDMFESLPPSAYTVKVGHGITSARYRVPSVDGVIDFLKIISKS